MIGTIISLGDMMMKNTPMLEVTVRKTDGTTKAYRIPKFKSELVEAIAALGPGENVDFTFQRNDKGFLNIVEVKKHEGELPEAPANAGGSGGGWNGRTGEQWNRSAAVYLAWEVIKDTELRNTMDQYMDKLFETASLIFDYIHTGVTPPPTADIPEPEIKE
jgi:hypothetical protein